MPNTSNNYWDKVDQWHKSFDKLIAITQKILNKIRQPNKDLTNLIKKLEEAEIEEERLRKELI